MSLKLVKAKIGSVKKTRQVTRAMEAVSAVKMRKSQHFALSLRGYAKSALHILKSIAGSQEAINHPLVVPRKVHRVGLIVIGTDKGLAGNLVSLILKKSLQFISEKQLSPAALTLFCVGRKAHEYFLKRGYTIGASYEHFGDIGDIKGVDDLLDVVEAQFVSRLIEEVDIVYTNFHSTLEQEVVIRRLLPLSFESVAEVIQNIIPEKGKFSELREEDQSPLPHYSFEPSSADILDTILPLLVRIFLFHAVLESNASEHSARMIAMKNASDNAEDLTHKLELSYNRARQAAITKEVSEIVGGMEAMRI